MTKSKTEKTFKKPAKPYPNPSTLWAYFMQAIEPTCEKINEAFPGYHPLWVQQSQRFTVSGQQFKYLRETVLQVNIKECAAYLRVTERQIKLWELEKSQIPFMAFELLRLVYQSTHFRLSHRDWAGWFITDNGRLVSPDRGDLSFVPADLSMVHEHKVANRIYKDSCNAMNTKVKELEREVLSLKRAKYEEALLNELDDLRLKMANVIGKMSEAKKNDEKYTSLKKQTITT